VKGSPAFEEAWRKLSRRDKPMPEVREDFARHWARWGYDVAVATLLERIRQDHRTQGLIGRHFRSMMQLLGEIEREETP